MPKYYFFSLDKFLVIIKSHLLVKKNTSTKILLLNGDFLFPIY